MSDDNNVSTKKQDINDDNQQEKLVPELRFPEFTDEWKEYKISELTDNIIDFRGKTPKKLGFKWGGNIPALSAINVKMGKIELNEETHYGSIGLYNKWMTQGDCEKDDVIITMEAPLGNVAQIPDDKKYILSQRVVLFKFKNFINKNFIAQYFRSNKFQKELLKLSTGTTAKGIKQKNLVKIKVKIPSYLEQKKDANILSLIDQKIDLLEKKSNLIKKYKHGVIQKLRKGKIRFKKDNKEDYKNWKEVKLNEVLFEHKLRYTGKEEVYSVSVHKGVVNQVEHLGRSFATKNLSKYKLVKPGDLIYTKSPTAGFELGIIKQNKNNKDVVVSPLYGVFTPKSKYLGNYLDAYFESSVNTRNYLHPIVQKGAKNTMNITNKVFLSKTLYLPSDLEEQKKISNFIDIINQKSEKINKDLLNMKQFKKGLLQKMFV